jgi:phosphoglycolate phosphatase-like HAD superfamily hydrolase
MNIKGILFDLDGTLANTLPMCIKAYRHTFEHFLQRSYTDEEITAYFGINEEGIIQKAMPEQASEGLAWYHRLYEAMHDECEAPFDGILEILDLLKQKGIALALVTGKGAYTAHMTLKYLDLDRYFTLVEAGDAHANIKAAAMRKILQAWQMEPQDAAYVGDSASDMTEAAAVGVLPLGACWAHTETIHQLTSMQPYATFTSVASFKDWIQQHIADVEDVSDLA